MLSIILISITLSGCPDITQGTVIMAVPVKSIILSSSAMQIVRGKTATLTATITPADSTNKTIIWTSSKPAIAKVSDTGLVEAGLTAGKTIITASIDGRTATCEVEVILPPPAESISITEGTSIVLAKNGTKSLHYTLNPTTSEDVPEWSSSNSTIVSVDNKGNITAGNTEDTATITVKVGDGTGGKKATCTVTVKEPKPATSISLSPTTLNIVKDSTGELTATVEPSDTTDDIIWETSNANIATVVKKSDNKATVTGKGLGNAIITAKAGSKTATCDISVRNFGSLIKADYTEITPPSGGISSVAPSYNLPGTEYYWKGVFIGGRTVSLAKYAIANSEVTYKLWKEVYDWAGSKGYTFANAGQKGSKDDNSGNELEPVTEVSWRDTVIWCNAYTEKTKGSTDECVYRKSSSDSTVLKNAKSTTEVDAAYFDTSKKGYRLPTEAEWEYAARYQGADSTNAVQYGDVYLTKLDSASGAKYPIGFSGVNNTSGKSWVDMRDEASRVAVYSSWYNGSSWQNLGTSKTASVKSKAANALGLYDMSGNVYELCWDWYGSITASTPITGQEAGTNRVSRGGSWMSNANLVSVGYRRYDLPDLRDYNLGFRLAWKTE